MGGLGEDAFSGVLVCVGGGNGGEGAGEVAGAGVEWWRVDCTLGTMGNGPGKLVRGSEWIVGW